MNTMDVDTRGNRLWPRPGTALFAAAAVWLAVGSPDASAQDASAQAVAACDPQLPCRLDLNLPAFRGNSDFKVSPNSKRVVYVLRPAGQSTADLYSAPLAGGEAPTKLDIPAAHAISKIAISPDGTHVVYAMSTEGSTQTHVYSVPITGPASANVRLSSDVGGSLDAGKFQISADSRKVVIESAAENRLRAVPIEGPATAQARLTDAMVSGGHIRQFAISDDSRSVVYVADQETHGVRELYRVPLTLSPDPNPPTAKLNAPLSQGRNVLDFLLAPRNGRVIYRADQEVDGVLELFSVRLGGGGRVKLNVPLPPGWFVVEPAVSSDTLPVGYSVTDDGARVTYEFQSSPPDPLAMALYSVPSAGPANASVRLDVPPTQVIGYRISPNGSRVVYAKENSPSPNFPAFSVPTVGPASAAVQLNLPSPAGAFFAISPNSQRVVWLFDGGPPGVLVSTPIAGPLGQGVRINGSEAPSTPFLIDASSSRVAYPGNTFAAGTQRNDLYSALLSGSGARLNLTESLSQPLINQLVLSPDGRFVVYNAIADTSRVPVESHLYSSRLAP